MTSLFPFCPNLFAMRCFLVAQLVKNLPTMKGILVRFLGQEDPLEKEMATHSSTLAWKIPWTEEPGKLQSMGLLRVGHNSALHFHFQSVNYGYHQYQRANVSNNYSSLANLKH